MAPTARWSAIAWLGVVLLWLSTALYAATTVGWVGPAEPCRGSNVEQYLRDYMTYRHELLPSEQVENWCLAVTLLALVVLAWRWSTGVIDGRRATARFIAVAFGVGSVIAAVAQVAYLGALVRVLAVVDVVEFDPAPLATMIDAIGRTDSYVKNLGFLLMAAAMVASQE